MPTREQLETALRNADAAGDADAARALANALKNGEYESSLLENIRSNPVAATAFEAMSGVNRAAVDALAFFTTDQINNILQLAGQGRPAPDLREVAAPATTGGYMEPGRARDVVQAGAEVVPAAVGGGVALRQMARSVPQTVSGIGSITQNIIKEFGKTTPALDAVMGFTGGAGAEIGRQQGGQVGEIVGGVVGPALTPARIPSASVREAAKNMMRGEATRQDVEARIADFARLGATPTAAQATDAPLIEAAESLSSQFLAGGSIGQSVNQTRSAVNQRLADIANDLTTVSDASIVGRTIQRGINDFADRFRVRSGQLWRAVDEGIGSDTRITPTNTRDALTDLVRDDSLAGIFNVPEMVRLRDALEASGNVVTYQDLASLRSVIGAKLGDTGLIADVPRSQLKRLYGAMSDDIRQLADDAGVLPEWTRANSFSRAGHNRISDFLDPIAKKTSVEDAFSAFVRGDAQKMNAIKRSLTPEQYEIVVGNVIRRMGLATPGQQGATDAGEEAVFSLRRFLTDWNRLSTQQKRALFSGSTRLNQYRSDLDAVARVASRVVDAGEVMRNRSQSGVIAANIGTPVAGAAALGTGNIGFAAGVVGAIAGNAALSRLLTNRQFVHWMARASDIKPDEVSAHVGRLATLAENAGAEDAALISTLLQALEAQSSQAGTQEQ